MSLFSGYTDLYYFLFFNYPLFWRSLVTQMDKGLTLLFLDICRTSNMGV